MVFGRSVAQRADGRTLAIRSVVSNEQRDRLEELDAEIERDLPWEAMAATALRDLPLALDDVARLLGLASRADAHRRVSLGRRPMAVLRSVRRLAPTHLRLLTGLTDAAFLQWVQRIERERLSVQALKRALEHAHGPPTNSADIQTYARHLSESLQTQVRIAWGPDPQKRQVAIGWYTPADLLGTMEKLGRAPAPTTIKGATKQRWITIHATDADELAAIFAGLAQA